MLLAVNGLGRLGPYVSMSVTILTELSAIRMIPHLVKTI
jgi:hypothetical protein